jgi:hypothetical protein
MLVGGFVFGIVIGSIAEVIRTSNPGDTARAVVRGQTHTRLLPHRAASRLSSPLTRHAPQVMGEIHAYLVEKRVPLALVKRVRAYFRNRLTEQSAIEASTVFDTLPPALRRTVGVAVG